LDSFCGRLYKCFPYVSTAMRMVIVGIPTVVIELVDKTNSQCAQDFHSQGREKISACYLVSHLWPDKICQASDDHQQNWCYYEIPGFQCNVVSIYIEVFSFPMCRDLGLVRLKPEYHF